MFLFVNERQTGAAGIDGTEAGGSGGRCGPGTANLPRPVKMSVPSPPPTSSSVGLNLDNGINYVKCATTDSGTGATNNPSTVPWPEPRTGSSNSSSSSRSSISISGPTSADDPQQQAPAGSPQSGPRRPKSGGWMWQRWVNPLPSLVSSLARAVSPLQRRTNDGGTSVASSSANRFKSAEEDGVRKRRHRRSNREVTPCECDASDGVKKQDEEERQDWPPVSWWRHRSGTGGIDVKLVLAITVLIGVIDYSEGNFLLRVLFSMKLLS